MTPWILSLILFLVPRAPFAATFQKTAESIDRVAHEAPLYPGEDGVERTAAELVAVAFFESHFDPKATFVEKDGSTSTGLLQINSSNERWLGVNTTDLEDPETNLRAAVKLMKGSHRACRGRPWAEQLALFTSGDTECRAGREASRHRLELAARLLREHPVYWIEGAS